MRKIAFLSMVAVLAASCSSDLIELPVASDNGAQQSVSGISDKINMTVTKATQQILEDVEFTDAANVYAQFNHELVSRSIVSILLPQLANVIDSITMDSVNQMLYVDFGKISGLYEQDSTQRAWTYNALPGSVQFDFFGVAGDTCTAAFSSDSSKVYTLETGNIQIKVPYIFSDNMYANGQLVGNGYFKTLAEEDSYSFITERNCGKLNLKYEFSSNPTTIGDMSNSTFSLKNGNDSLFAVSSRDVDNSVWYSIELGNSDSDFINFEISSLDIQKFFDLLAANAELMNGPVSEDLIDSITLEVESFNYESAIKFEYESADTSLTGIVNLVLREPNAYFDNYRVCIALKYQFEGAEEMTTIEAPVEEVAMIISDIIDGCHMVAANYIRIQARFMQFQHMKMVRAFEFYARAIERRIRIINHIAGDVIDMNAEFLRGLDSMFEEYFRGLDEYINNFPAEHPYIRG